MDIPTPKHCNLIKSNRAGFKMYKSSGSSSSSSRNGSNAAGA
jgi:hypothetical protein